MADTLYQVYRVYSAKERPDVSERSVFYGWSTKKSVIKAFMEQRNQKKYRVVKVNSDIPEGYYPHAYDATETMIDYVKLKFASNGKTVYFFTTQQESKEAEIKIQQHYHDLCSIPDEVILNMFLNLDEYYRSALEFIGFRPPEVDAMFDCADDFDNYNTMSLVEREIEDAYDGMGANPPDTSDRYEDVPGLMTISQVSDKIVYSVENYVKVLRDEL